VGVLQFILLVGVIVLLGYFVITSDLIGGWDAFTLKVTALEKEDTEVPGLINFGLGVGWTALMILT